jgi:hypothetical protein
MEREVCSGRLWYPDCQAANSDLPQALPENFTDAGESLLLLHDQVSPHCLVARLDIDDAHVALNP